MSWATSSATIKSSVDMWLRMTVISIDTENLRIDFENPAPRPDS